MKYPIGIQNFKILREEGFVYVDKTDLVYSLVKNGNVYFLSRPRRFGKSLLLSTIESYFSGDKALFEGLAIDKLEQEWKRHPIFHIDFNGVDFTKPGAAEAAIESYMADWESTFGVANSKLPTGQRFAKILEAAHSKTGERCVVLVDEYDKPLLDIVDAEAQSNGGASQSGDEVRNTLKTFYSTFKLANEHLRFVFLTGITKFSQVSVFSGFNQPKDISMDPRYATLCGITDEELDQYFTEAVAEMAHMARCDSEEMRSRLKKRFDGYHFCENAEGVYNPFSLLNTLDSKVMRDYWFGTGTPTYLIRLLNNSDENIDELAGHYYTSSMFMDFKSDEQRPLPMIYQSGYLTIKGYDSEMEEYLLDMPNDEVRRGFLSLISNNYLKTADSAECWVTKAVKALKSNDLELFRDHLTSFLSSIPYQVRRKENERERERFFHYTFYLILRLASTYLVYTEKQSSHGRVDSIVETKDFVYIFEFKLDGTADEALRQIAEKGYAAEYATDRRTIRRIGCSFSSETGTISDWKVE